MLGRLAVLVAVAVVVIACCAPDASAQVVFGQPGAYGLGVFDYGSGGYWGGNYRIPYYALFPPVYYSYPVARPYGYSPFAYPPGTVTPELPPKAAIYRNPFVPQPAKTSQDKTASAPRVYLNPFVKQNADALAAAKP
jgi:hypothetical protein